MSRQWGLCSERVQNGGALPASSGLLASLIAASSAWLAAESQRHHLDLDSPDLFCKADIADAPAKRDGNPWDLLWKLQVIPPLIPFTFPELIQVGTHFSWGLKWGYTAEKPGSPVVYSCTHSALELLYLIASVVNGFFLSRTREWRRLKRASLSLRKRLTVALGHEGFFCFPGKTSPSCCPKAICTSPWGPVREFSRWFYFSGCGNALKWMVVKVKGSAETNRQREWD